MEDLEAALEAASEAGVTRVIAMGVDGPSSEGSVRLAEQHPGVFAAAGHHPLNQLAPDLSLLRRLAAHPKVVAIGEVGLDHVDEHRGPHDQQQLWFDSLCRLAIDCDLPVCVHTRECTADVYATIRSHPGLRGVMHYFNLEAVWADRFLDLGFYISFSGVVTRASRGDLREVARSVPEDRLLVETDAPWGTPRGRSGTMRPAWMRDTAELLAELRGLSIEEFADLELRNARRLFTRLI